MDEKTIVKTVPLHPGRDWEWLGDANMVLLAPHLDEAGRERALSELQSHWRRACLRVAGNVAADQQTIPMPAPSLRDILEAR